MTLYKATLFERAIDVAYPGTIKQGDGKRFVRPYDFGVYEAGHTGGFYYENADGDRFYFATRAEAAKDLAQEIGMDEAEAALTLRSGKSSAPRVDGRN